MYDGKADGEGEKWSCMHLLDNASHEEEGRKRRRNISLEKIKEEIQVTSTWDSLYQLAKVIDSNPNGFNWIKILTTLNPNKLKY